MGLCMSLGYSLYLRYGCRCKERKKLVLFVVELVDKDLEGQGNGVRSYYADTCFNEA
jgi:hypothetical protein